MLPPENVPTGLNYVEYVKLQLRYNSIGWMKQSARAMHLAVTNQPDNQSMSEEVKKRAGALFDALEKVLILNEFSEEIQKQFAGICDFTLGEADKLLDNIQYVKQAKDGLKSAFTLVTQTIQETVDSSLERTILPALGLPLDRIAEGKTAEEYFQLALRYEQIGACEPARHCAQRVLDLELKKDTQLANRAQRFMKARLPARKVSHEAMIKYMSALRYTLMQKEEKARNILVELEVKHPNFEWPLVPLAALELKNGNLDRCKHLLNRAQQVNPSFIKMWCAKGRLAIAEWFLLDLDYSVERANSLDSFDTQAKALTNIQQFVNQNGLR
jgi:tetratricopeptide (TPR) repeat protein